MIADTEHSLTGRGSRCPRPAFLILSALCLSAFSLKFLPMPFAWIASTWAVTLGAAFWRLRADWSRLVLLNLAVLAAIIGAVEAFMGWHSMQDPTYSDSDRYWTRDDVLGYVPARQTRAHASRQSGRGKHIYSVTYTIGSNGLRIAPPSGAATIDGAVLFFGCSFTYGEGVRDAETMPYQVGILSGGRYRTYNFSFHGYGPNQMLAAIESGRVRQAVAEVPRFAIYQALPDHVARVAGKIPYAEHSPRYRLEGISTIRLAGHFDDGQNPPSALRMRLKSQLRKSVIYRTLTNLRPSITEEDVGLLLAIVGRSRDLLCAEYPGLQFQVILWRNFESEERTYQQLREGLFRMNIPVHLAKDILPDYSAHREKYLLDADDGHPNALANQLLAHYVVSRILCRYASSQSGN